MKLNHKHIAIIGISLVGVFFALSLSIAYLTGWSDPISQSFKKLYPSVVVGSRLFSVEQSDEFVRLAAKTDPAVSRSAAFANFLDRAKQEVILAKLGIKIPSDAIPDEKQFYLKGNEDAYRELINAYFGGKEDLFVANVVRPEVVESSLQIYYNSRFDLNQQAYNKAKSILSQLTAGAKFEDLAKAQSDDLESAQLGGDLGFIGHSQVLPELEKEIAIAKTGEVDQKIIVTREGYEIIYPIEVSEQNGRKLWHAKHILVQTSGFEQWLAGQTAAISARVIKKY